MSDPGGDGGVRSPSALEEAGGGFPPGPAGPAVDAGDPGVEVAVPGRVGVGDAQGVRRRSWLGSVGETGSRDLSDRRTSQHVLPTLGTGGAAGGRLRRRLSEKRSFVGRAPEQGLATAARLQGKATAVPVGWSSR